MHSNPDLIPIAFPLQWQQLYGRHDFRLEVPQVFDAEPLDEECILNGFNRLLQDTKICNTHRFCFFIDALDEHNDPLLQNDHNALVRMLKSWVLLAQGSLKICISSREDNVFFEQLLKRPTLMLQDLTRLDMQRYVRDRLSEVMTNSSDDLICSIVDRANGILLWTALVINALHDSINNGGDASDFEAILKDMPSKLEGLLKHLLETIPVGRKKNTHCLITLIQSHKNGFHLTLIYNILGEVLERPRVLLADRYSQQISPFKKVENEHGCKYTKGTINFVPQTTVWRLPRTACRSPF